MTPETLAERLDKKINQALNNLDKSIVQTQKEIYEQLITVLKGLETDKDGYILQSQANRKIIAKASTSFNKSVKQSGYYDSIQAYVNIIPSLDKVNGAYFDFISSGYKPNAQYISSLKNQTISDLESLLMNEGLESQVKKPLLNILNQNINSSAKFTDLLAQIKEYTTGNEQIDGQLLRYSKQITTDALFNYSRSYQQAVTSDLGLEWYLYAGGITKEGKFSSGSRPFCISRAGNYYHHSEIEDWAKLDWEGKRRGTTSSTIFIYAGGYYCGHQIIPVHESVVPKESLNRINV